MSSVSVDTGVIANHLPRFDGDINNYEAGYKKMESDYNSMLLHVKELDAMWTGEAKDELTAKFDVDKKKADLMFQDLLQTYKELKFAHQEYSACEKKVEGIIGQL